jgi:asparagine synthase (glutamine-hydrolysing)
MCGICGVFQVDGELRRVVPPEVLDRMTDSMTHRGPNDRGTYASPGAAIGARRLSIVDVAGGHQPVSNEDGTIWASQNGELYNHVELRGPLEADGHVLRSRCDTEVLPHLYERYGTSFPKLLRGKFGLALWDERRRRGVVARDRLGVKPIYHARAGDLLVFGSELKAVLASGLFAPELDYDAIDAYLTFGFVPGPATLLKGISKLEPGHLLVVEDGAVRDEAYWEYPHPRVDRRLTTEEYEEGLLEQLDEAVRLRLMSDVPLGAMLSGGLDSSLVVALMARHMDEPVKTFSIGFAEAGSESELGDARRVSRLFGTDHRELELSFLDGTVAIDDLLWHLDEPIADISGLGFLALSKLASEHVTVALSGQGADELLGGYKKHRAAALVRSALRVPGSRAAAALLAPHGPARSRRALETLAAPDAVARLIAMSGHVDASTRASLYRGALAGPDGDAAAAAVRRCLGDVADEPLAATLHVDAQLALPDSMLLYFDRASMAHSLEVRVPFLDHELVEYCARIPVGLKVRRQTTKYVLKRAARRLLPDEIVDKRKLGFFRPAFGGWLRAQLQAGVGDYLLGPAPRYAEFLDRDAVERLARSQLRGERADTYLLLAILMLEVWLATYLPRAGAAAAPARERVVVPA